MTRRPLFLAAALLSLGLASSSQAAFTVYTTQASFLAALSASGVDTFNDLPGAPVASPLVRTAGAFGYTASAAGGPGTGNFFPAGTAADRWLSTDSAADPITFSTFTGGGVTAIGGFFFTSNLAGTAVTGSITLTATDNSGTTTTTVAGTTPSTFRGFITDGTLTSLQVASVTPVGGANFWPTVNNLTLGTALPVAAVPAPAGLVLLATGLPVVGLVRRLRRAA